MQSRRADRSVEWSRIEVLKRFSIEGLRGSPAKDRLALPDREGSAGFGEMLTVGVDRVRLWETRWPTCRQPPGCGRSPERQMGPAFGMQRMPPSERKGGGD